MATATPPSAPVPAAGPADRHQRARGPLDRLRGTIRLYVALEGLAVLVIYLALWFWITFAIDYGLFQARSVDWAQAMPTRAFRALLLGAGFTFVLALVGLFRADRSPTRLSGQRPSVTFQGVALVVGMLLLLAAPLVYFILQGQYQAIALVMLTFHLLVMTAVLIFAAVRIITAGHSALWYTVGVALAHAYIAAWALVGRARDGSEAMGPVAAVCLAVLAAAPVVYVVCVMLLTIFSDSALALVLERRFPKQLGDRLITAIELSDPRLAARYGFSQAMIDRTTDEAAAEVARLPVNDVFDWGRLLRYGLFVLGLTGGMVGLALAGFWAFSHQHRHVATEFTANASHLTGLWFERDVLLNNTPWPRQAQLDVIGFPESGDLRVGRNAPAPTVRVRAAKWLIVDRGTPDGWRPARWADLTPALLGKGALPPAPTLTGDAAAMTGWTIDEIEQRLPSRSYLAAASRPARALSALGLGAGPGLAGLVGATVPLPLPDTTVGPFRLDGPTVAALSETHDVLAVLARTAARPDMQGRFRALAVPDKAMLIARGDTVYSEITLKREAGNDFIGEVANLTETVAFQANALDYYTASRTITVVPPPVLIDLEHTDARPAYLYHRPYRTEDRRGDDPGDRDLLIKLLAGERHTPPAEKVGLTGDLSALTVPMGSDVTLTGQVGWLDPRDRERKGGTDPGKHLATVKVVPRKGQSAGLPAEARLRDDRRTFDVVLKDVRSLVEFEVIFEDNDLVTGRRAVRVEPERDRAPEVNLQVDSIIRKNTGGQYLVTPFARVPFVGEVNDDHGLQGLDYIYTRTEIDSSAVAGRKAAFGAWALGLTPLTMPVTAHLGTLRLVFIEPEAEPVTAPFASFRQALQQLAARDVAEPEFRRRLKLKLTGLPPLLTRFPVQPDREGLDLKELGLKDKEDSGLPIRYRLRVWARAIDTNVHEKGTGESKERFSFQVVPVQELLSEIDKEEEGLRLKLDQVLKSLREARGERFDAIAKELQDPAEAKKAAADAQYAEQFFKSMASLASRIGEQVGNGETSVKEVANDYDRILRELKANLREVMKNGEPEHEMIARVVAINRAFALVLAGDGPFAAASRSVLEFQEKLDGRTNDPASMAIARDRLDQLIVRMEDLLKLLGDLTSYNKVLETAYQLKVRQLGINTDIGAEKDRIEKKFLEDLLGPGK